jgi:2-polyprenyl-6-methoxyphenol hydroxylase-like FAD-dependent oxidoreductase
MAGKTVLISGLGVAGPTLAYWLKAAGFQPTLIERAPALRSGGYIVDFWGLGFDIAERMGLGDELDRIGYHIREMRIVNRRGRRVAGLGTNVFFELTEGRYVTIARSALSRLLTEKVGDYVDMIFGDEIRSLRECEDCIEVELGQRGKRKFDLVVGRMACIRMFAVWPLVRRIVSRSRWATWSPPLKRQDTGRAMTACT